MQHAKTICEAKAKLCDAVRREATQTPSEALGSLQSYEKVQSACLIKHTDLRSSMHVYPVRAFV